MALRFWQRCRKSSPRRATEAGSAAVGPATSAPSTPDGGLTEKADALERWDATRRQAGDRRRYLLYGTRPEPLPSFRGTFEEPADGKVGICCSGGGIRSAAYNLGALQSLYKQKEFEKASYLATVSGGSYIAAAFTMVAKTWRKDKCRPPDRDASGFDDSNPELLKDCPPFAPGSPEEQYLRNRSSYLAPDGMGKLFLAYRIVLGLLFNLFFVTLPLFGASLILGQVLYREFVPKLVGDCGSDPPGGCVADIPRGWWIAPLAIVGLSVALALWGMIIRARKDRRTRFFEVWGSRTLLAGGAVGLLLVALPNLVDAFHGADAVKATGVPETGAGIGTGSVALAGLIAGILAQLREVLATPKQAVEALNTAQKRLRGLSAKARLALAYAAGALIGPLFLLATVVFGLSFALAKSPYGSGWWDGMNWWVVGGGGGALLLFALLYLVADITTWSLHPVYKRRLCTAFALKRVRASDLVSPERNRVQAPVESEEAVAMERDYDRLVDLSDTVPEGRWPTLLVCAAANVSDPGATPPGRHVTSFTFSAYSIGGPLVGGAPTKAFENAFGGRNGSQATSAPITNLAERRRLRERRVRRDFSLPAAVAVSGAALSPSMGKLTRRPLTFLLALANIRLGVWMPNPRWVEGAAPAEHKWHRRPRPMYLLRELLGRNRVNGRYLYVTDGGHYENLGLVELLRRGCTEIYCFDASGGKDSAVLGDAVSLARSEVGVEIDIDPSNLFPSEGSDNAKSDTVVAKFTYRDPEAGQRGKTGTLVYARSVLTKGVPWDVKAHHEEDPRFPHNSTVDQLYTDQKFEGYRALGERAGRNAVGLMKKARAGSCSVFTRSGRA